VGAVRAVAEHAPEVAIADVRIWEISGAEHTGGLSARPEEYERRVVGFFDRTLR
jgi:hypothetical protein